MELKKSDRGFVFLLHDTYLPQDQTDNPATRKLASESSAIGDYADSFDRPGSSFLWIGMHHHLNREQVTEFVSHLQRWLETGRLADKE